MKPDKQHVSAISQINQYLENHEAANIEAKKAKNENYIFWFDLKQAGFEAIKEIRKTPDIPPLDILELLYAKYESYGYRCKHEAHRAMFWHYCDAIECLIDYILGG